MRDLGNEVAGDIDHRLDEGNLEMPSDAACEYKSTSVPFISN